MNVLLVNKYFYPRGGSERTLFDTAALLQAEGHEVSFFSMSHPKNRETSFSRFFVSEIDYEHPGSPVRNARAAARLLYSTEARTKLARLLDMPLAALNKKLEDEDKTFVWLKRQVDECFKFPAPPDDIGPRAA